MGGNKKEKAEGTTFRENYKHLGRAKGSTYKDNPKTGYISARVNKSTEDFFRENKKLMGSGSVSSLILDIFPILYNETIKQMKKDFNRDELLIILTSFKGNVGHPSSEYSRLKPIKNNKFNGFDFVTFELKFLNLTLSDRFIIEIWANKFWNGVTVGSVRNTSEDPEEYIK
ncbi:MAG: hypothetical protein QQN55_08885 [Nitrosopumilus sp.]